MTPALLDETKAGLLFHARVLNTEFIGKKHLLRAHRSVPHDSGVARPCIRKINYTRSSLKNPSSPLQPGRTFRKGGVFDFPGA